MIGANLIAANVLVSAGSGHDGLNGGAGGSLVNVHLDRTSSDFVHHAEFNAGNGGNGTLLAGGAGGAVLNLTTGEARLLELPGECHRDRECRRFPI